MKTKQQGDNHFGARINSNVQNQQNKQHDKNQTYIQKQKQKNSFATKAPRFKSNEIPSLTPGPGSYDSLSQLKKMDKHSFHSPKNKDTPNNKEFHWIIDPNQRASFIPNVQNKLLGPGSYDYFSSSMNINKNDTQNHTKNVGCENDPTNQKSSWDKSNRFFLNNPEKNLDLKSFIGPGTYNLQNTIKRQKPSASAAFKSKVAKSFLEQIYQKQQKQRSKTHENSIKGHMFNGDRIESDGEPQKSTQKIAKKQNNSSAFASNVQRFNRLKKEDSVGPGTYQVEIKKNRKQKLPRIITIKQGNRPKQFRKPVKAAPGPGSYDIRKATIAQQVSLKGNTGITSKEERFCQLNKQKSPGPGHYNQNKFMYMVQLNQKNRQQMSLPNSLMKSSFLSHSQRSNLILSSKDNPFGTYNSDIFSMQYRLKKKIQHLQKLKIMEVDVPAFNSNGKR